MSLRFKNVLFLCGVFFAAQLYSAEESAILTAMNTKKRSMSEWFGDFPVVQCVYPLTKGTFEVGTVRGDLSQVPLYRGDEKTGWRTLQYIWIVNDPRGFRRCQESLDKGYAQCIKSSDFTLTEDAEFVKLPVVQPASVLSSQGLNLPKSLISILIPWAKK